MGKMIFHKSGLLTSIQDHGRLGWKKYGIPQSGAMDLQSATLANLLVNNTPEIPVIEITLHGPVIEFTQSTTIALTGANLSAVINHHPCPLNQPLNIIAGDCLSFGKPTEGVRCYLAIADGFETPYLLNSFSQYDGITPKSQILIGDQLSYSNNSSKTSSANARIRKDQLLFADPILKAYPGPEFEQLSTHSRQWLFHSSFCIEANNRMGYHLQNDTPPTHTLEIITSQVIPGTIQLTPSGKLLALMRDAQVTGGYPRILQLTERSMNQLAQKNTGAQIQLRLISYQHY